MPYSPYEWNESVNQRNDYIEDRLKEGSPVVCLSYDSGVLLLTLRKSQRKIYEIYDRLMFSAIGNQSDIESIRTGAIDIAHREGFSRSPDDVSIQRIVGFAVSPSIKKVYADPYGAPVVLRAIFAELGKSPQEDQFFVVSYDGEFTSNRGMAVIAGTSYAELRMREQLAGDLLGNAPDLQKAAGSAVRAWAIGRLQTDPNRDDADEAAPEGGDAQKITDFLANALQEGWQVEASVLERSPRRESRYRSLTEAETEAAVETYRSASV